MNKVIPFITYPFSLLVILILVVSVVGFFFFFIPDFLMSVTVIATAFFLFIFWFIIGLQSSDYVRWLNKTPSGVSRKLTKIIKRTEPGFRESASACQVLIKKINEEFADLDYRSELSTMQINLLHLARSNQELYHRSRSFGVQEQKSKMQDLLDRHVTSIRNAFDTLKTFSGNLTIMDAANDTNAYNQNRELRYINQGLQEIIKDMKTE